MYKLPLGLSVHIGKPKGFYNDKYNYELEPNFIETVYKMEELGFDSIDIDFDTVYIPSDMYLFTEGLDVVKKSKLTFNCAHMPINFSWCDLASPYPIDRVGICDMFIRFINYLKDYGCRAICFHPGGLTLGESSVNESNLNEYLKYLEESLNYISNNVDLDICIENMSGQYFLSTSSQMLHVLENCPKVYTCVDVNHFYHEKAWEAIPKYKDRIGAVHISDYDFIKERHMLPKEGLNDWNKIIDTLKKANFKYSFNYELSRTYNYSLESIKKNYEELFDEYNNMFSD